MTTGIAIFRVQKHKSCSIIRKFYKHALRLSKPNNADPSRTHLNEVEVKIDANSYIREVESLRKRKDNVLALELLVTFSAAGTPIDLEGWKKRAKAWIDSTFGADNIALRVLHMDETTPHYSVLVMPKVNGKLNAKYWTAGGKALRKLQDSYWEAVRELGLERGKVGSKQKHTRIKTFYESLNSPCTALPEPKMVRTLAGLAERMEYADEYKIRAEKAVQILSDKAKALSAANKRIEELNRLVDRAQNEAKALRERLRDLPLEDVMRRLGYEQDIKKSDNSRSVWRTQAGKISIQGSKFFNFNENKGGGGAIDLVMHIEQRDFKEAIGRLKALFGIEEVEKAYRYALSTRAKQEVANVKPVYAPVRDDSKLSKVRAYLVQRGIPEDIIEAVLKKNDLYANNFGSCVFRHRNFEGQVTGYTVRGTSSEFKQTIGSKSQGWFMLGSPFKTAKQIVLVESPIDAMSYYSLRKCDDSCVVSLCGNSIPPKLIQALASIGKKPIVFALDSDSNPTAAKAVNAVFERLKGIFPTLVRETPPQGKDWNESILGLKP